MPGVRVSTWNRRSALIAASSPLPARSSLVSEWASAGTDAAIAATMTGIVAAAVSLREASSRAHESAPW
jgi:hypothetical protein